MEKLYSIWPAHARSTQSDSGGPSSLSSTHNMWAVHNKHSNGVSALWNPQFSEPIPDSVQVCDPIQIIVNNLQRISEIIFFITRFFLRSCYKIGVISIQASSATCVSPFTFSQLWKLDIVLCHRVSFFKRCTLFFVHVSLVLVKNESEADTHLHMNYEIAKKQNSVCKFTQDRCNTKQLPNSRACTYRSW